jgi:hypothetical protein
VIQKCPDCKPHSFQDARYGEKVRVMNPLKKAAGEQQKVRCTVCAAEAFATAEREVKG